MPTYEYRCPNGHEFEKLQKISDPAEAECPECGEKAERMISGGAGLLFKGSGFYITDYRPDSYKEAAKKEKPKPAEGGSSEAKKTPADKSKASGESKSGGES